MQYNICFCDNETIDFFYNIHKRAICALLGQNPRFFGFKWRTSEKKFVCDLYGYIDSICTATYRRLCALTGRPTLLDIARRATKVLVAQAPQILNPTSVGSLRPRQSKFAQKIENFNTEYDLEYPNPKHPRENDFFTKLSNCRTNRERSMFIRLSTDSLLRTHLETRGHDIPNISCRMCPQNSTSHETLDHIFDIHIDDKYITPLAPKFKRKIATVQRLELDFLDRQDKNKRIRLDLEAHTVQFFMHGLNAKLFPDVSVKYRARTKNAAPKRNYKKRKK